MRDEPLVALIRVVDRFGTVPVLRARRVRPRGGTAVVRVTHASLSTTDLQAIRGDYLLHPLRGFVPGYDLVGVVEELAPGSTRLAVGQRVAAMLPGMGAHTTRAVVSERFLVPVPDGLDPAVAACVPLDALTAVFALDTLDAVSDRRLRTLLVQGATGSVGRWAVQIAAARGLKVLGTGSARNLEPRVHGGIALIDHRDGDLAARVRALVPNGVDGVLDHTGSAAVLGTVRPGGVIARIAFGGEVGRQNHATFIGAARASLLRWSTVRERTISTPFDTLRRPHASQRALESVLQAVAAGSLAPPAVTVRSFHEYARALDEAAVMASGSKLVLSM